MDPEDSWNSLPPKRSSQPALRSSPEPCSIFSSGLRVFFGHLALGATPYVVFVTFICGVAYTIGRLDKQMTKADLGTRQNQLEALGIIDSWILLWGFVLAVGAVSALLLWGIGGWWYHLRVRWSGARDADPFTARLVYIYSSFVFALPAVLIVGVATILYSSYREYWHAEEVWSSVWLVFLFWSCVTSYQGVKTMFPVSLWKARLWFLILPILVYVAAFGVVVAAYVLRGP